MEDKKIINENVIVDSVSTSEMSIKELVIHVWNLWLHPWDRISRGEYILSTIPFGIMSGLLLVVISKIPGEIFTSIFAILALIFAGISIITSIRVAIARLHDINKSAWYILWYILWCIIVSLIWVSTRWFISGVIESVGLGWYIFTWAFMIFLPLVYLYLKKWTAGENKYGSDPLPRQDKNNTNYWLLWIVWTIISLWLNWASNLQQELMMQWWNNLPGYQMMEDAPISPMMDFGDSNGNNGISQENIIME